MNITNLFPTRKPGNGDAAAILQEHNSHNAISAGPIRYDVSEMQRRGPVPETPEVRRNADGAVFLIYRQRPEAKVPETGFPPHITELIGALAEARTTVLAEARDAVEAATRA